MVQGLKKKVMMGYETQPPPLVTLLICSIVYNIERYRYVNKANLLL